MNDIRPGGVFHPAGSHHLKSLSIVVVSWLMYRLYYIIAHGKIMTLKNTLKYITSTIQWILGIERMQTIRNCLVPARAPAIGPCSFLGSDQTIQHAVWTCVTCGWQAASWHTLTHTRQWDGVFLFRCSPAVRQLVSMCSEFWLVLVAPTVVTQHRRLDFGPWRNCIALPGVRVHSFGIVFLDSSLQIQL